MIKVTIRLDSKIDMYESIPVTGTGVIKDIEGF